MEKRDLNDDPPPPYPGTSPEAAPPYSSAVPQCDPKYGPQLYPGLDMGPQIQSGPGPQQHIGATQQNIVVQHVVGPDPIHIICPSCHAEITTKIEPKVNTRTHIMAGILCVLFGIFCVWLPYCLDVCKNADHYCPNCEAYIGTYTR